MAAIVAARMTEQAYRELALTDAGKLVELWDGEPREKPAMSIEHNWLMAKLDHLLQPQLDWETFQVRVNTGRLRRPGRNYYVPDVAVIPAAAAHALRTAPGSLEIYDQSLPLVVEVWSPSTGTYDVTEKLGAYQRRGDEEIWYLHPYQRTLTVWRRQGDGSYHERVYQEGIVRPSSLPGVAIDLGELFDG